MTGVAVTLRPHAVLAAGGLAGLLAAAGEGLHLLSGPAVDRPAELLLGLAARLGGLGMGLALLALVAGLAGRGLRRLRVPAPGLLAMLLLAAAGAGLLVAGKVSREAPVWAALFFLVAGALGPLPLCAAVMRSVSRFAALLMGAAGLAAAVLLPLLDPGRLRGTYAALDLLLLGLALAGGGVACATWLAARGRLLQGAALAGVGLLVVPPLALGVSVEDALVVSPRLRLLEGALVRPLLGGSLSHSPQRVDPRELFTPPEPPGVTRSRWRSLRGGTQRPWSVLWVTIDALPSRITGLNGGTATPHLDALASEGVGFPNAFSQAPGTFPSGECMFRSRYPGSRYVDEQAVRAGRAREEDFPPLAAILKAEGFATWFVSGVPSEKLRSRMFTNLPTGFQVQRAAAGSADARVTARQVGTLLEAHPDERFFCWVHLFDPHYPYEARGEVSAGAPPKERWLSEVRYADRALGSMLGHLRRTGRADTTVVVVNADHGEAFGEHGRYFHSTSYYDVQIHVPLVFRVPRLPPGTCPAPVGNVDVVPTLLELLDLPRRPWMQGASLLPSLLQPGCGWPRAAFAETLNVGSGSFWAMDRIRMATDGRWKLLHYLDDDLLQLFDRRSDPGERRNLAHSEPRHTARLLGWLQALDRHLGRAEEEGAAQETTDPLLEELEAPDPEARLRAVRAIMSGSRHDLYRDLEVRLGSYRPAVAHQLLVLMQDLLIPRVGFPPVELPLPRHAGPLRYRLIRRYAFQPRYRELPLPADLEPLCGHDRLALREARAARGARAAAERLLAARPSSRERWKKLAVPLAMGGHVLGGHLLVAGLRGAYPQPEPLMQALRALAAGRNPAFSAAVCARWPAAQPQLPERHYAEVVDLAVSGRQPAWLPALVALHPGALPGDRRRLEDVLLELQPAWSREAVAEVGRHWARARYEELEGGGGAALRRAVAALPQGARLPPLEREAARSGRDVVRQVSTGQEIAILVENLPGTPDEAVTGPPQIRLRAAGDRPVAVGPGTEPTILLAWTGAAELPAGHLSPPRMLLAEDWSQTFHVPLDLPKEPGRYHLVAGVRRRNPHRTGSRKTIPLPHIQGALEHTVPRLMRFDGHQVARLFSSNFLKLVALDEGAGLEQVAGLPAELTSPSMELPAGSVTVRLRYTPHAASGEPLAVHAVLPDAEPVLLGRPPDGRSAELEATLQLPTAGRRTLALRWEPASALHEIRAVTLTY